MAVGVIFNAAGEVLIAQRPAHLHQGGLWEFPGGKLEADETVLQALARELREEVGIVVEQAAFWFTQEYHYPDKSVALHICKVTQFVGQPQSLENQPLRWIAVPELPQVAVPAANRAVVEALIPFLNQT